MVFQVYQVLFNFLTIILFWKLMFSKCYFSERGDKYLKFE